ncbi:MAG: SRPBCC family protein [Chloroflexi bacterium]|nr:SRPBCC family protein [Chloroflexota bacterium]
MKVRLAKDIAAPANITFDVFTDLNKAQDRIDGITRLEILSEQSHGVGTRWRETRLMFGREATEEMEISAFEPNHSYEVVASSHGANYHTIYTFTEVDGGTRVEMVFTGTPVSLVAKLMAPLGFLFQGSTRTALDADMDNLKAVCEQMAAGQDVQA